VDVSRVSFGEPSRRDGKVKYRSGAALRQALEQRLLRRSRESAISLVRLRKAVVFDRLLARLAAAAPGRWVLKGALALDFRLGDRTRTTKDMDLVRRDDEDAAAADFIAAAAMDVVDFFTFAIEKVRAPREELEGVAIRYRARTELGGRPFEEVIIDVAFSDPLDWNPESVRASDILAPISRRSTCQPFRSSNTSRRKSISVARRASDAVTVLDYSGGKTPCTSFARITSLPVGVLWVPAPDRST
jgi:Nucleotidyl transferase AbiEii toxin, Type IV TA system